MVPTEFNEKAKAESHLTLWVFDKFATTKKERYLNLSQKRFPKSRNQHKSRCSLLNENLPRFDVVSGRLTIVSAKVLGHSRDFVE